MTDVTTNTQTDPALNTSAGNVSVSGATSTPTPGAGAQPVDAERFNGLMASFNREQSARQTSEAEVARLQGLLSTAVATEIDLRAQITTLGAGNTESLSAAEGRAAVAASNVAELTQQVARLTADNVRLQFLVDQPDLGAYAAVLPTTGNKEDLDRAAAAIRSARTADESRVREHLAGSGSRGAGGPPRVTGQQMSPSQIKDYLDNAPPGEFEKRFAEVTSKRT